LQIGFSVFASNWSGDQFALDSKRTDHGEYLVLLFVIGTGDALEIPATFNTFHDSELTQEQEALLLASRFQTWLSSGGAAPRRDQCVGYRIPLSLGGEDNVTNLEIDDMEVYWSLSSQIATQTKELPPGTRIGRIKLD
jgi:hypothetical protein